MLFRSKKKKEKEKIYIYIYIYIYINMCTVIFFFEKMCTVNLRTKNYERKQCYIKAERKRERELLISSRGPPTFLDFVTSR